MHSRSRPVVGKVGGDAAEVGAAGASCCGAQVLDRVGPAGGGRVVSGRQECPGGARAGARAGVRMEEENNCFIGFSEVE